MMIKFDTKNNLAAHFVFWRGKHKNQSNEKKKRQEKKMVLQSLIRAPQPINATCGGRPW